MSPPPGRVTLAAMRAYAEAGVHRLVLHPGHDGGCLRDFLTDHASAV